MHRTPRLCSTRALWRLRLTTAAWACAGAAALCPAPAWAQPQTPPQTSPPSPPQTAYRGLCDASAGTALDGTHFVVADDESNVLRIYRSGTQQPVRTLDLTEHLGSRKPNGKVAEADIEGAARIGSRIYWISSHARKGGDGSVDPYRQRFFATDTVPATGADGQSPSLQPVGTAYTQLLQDLLADPRLAVLAEAAARSPEAEGGLNIEGLAATADGGLLIGFRNPLPEGRALLVPLRNPREVIEQAARPLFGAPIRLDLGGRGIRSLDRVGAEWLIAAGPVAGAASSPVRPAFALLRWSGVAGQAARFVQGLDAGSFRPEVLLADGPPGSLLLLSDDGDEPVGDKDCKARSVPEAEKSFRARSLQLGAASPPCRVDRTAAFAGETLRLARPQALAPAANLGLFKAPLAVNTDGAPTSYHPLDYRGERLAINHLDNGIVVRTTTGAPLTQAQRIQVFDRWRLSGWQQVPPGHRITWQNVIAAVGGKPCVFSQGEHAGYFGSLTALNNGLPADAAGECGVHNQLDQRLVPALVLRGSQNPLRSWGAALGDLALAINPATGAMVPAIIGDSGNAQRVGEGSVALNRALLTGTLLPATYRQALALDTGTRDMVVAVLPGSRGFQPARPYSADNIAQRVQSWAQAQGYPDVQALGAAALQCAAGL